MRKANWLWAIALVILLACPALANDVVISWGADLSLAQKEQVRKYFPEGEAKEMILTHQEECNYLRGLVPDKVMGSRAISSVYVEKLPAGEGIQVETFNTNWVNGDMFRNVLATAGVTDAKVIAASPITVSGTAALAGMFKGFEAATGKTLDDESKKAAAEEMVTTGDIANSIGDQEKAAELVSIIKEKVIKDKLSDSKEIEKAVEDAAAELSISLTREEVDDLIALMKKLSSMDWDKLAKIVDQVQDINAKLDKALNEHQEIKGMLEKLWDLVKEGLNKLFEMLQSNESKDSSEQK